MSTSDPAPPPFVPNAAVRPVVQAAPADAWGHEVGEDTSRLLDATGHMPHQHEVLAHLIGAPKVIGRRDRVQRAILRACLGLLSLGIIGGVAWWFVAVQHVLR